MDIDELKYIYFSFEGRISRSQYWLKLVLPLIIIQLLLTKALAVLHVSGLSFVVAIILAWINLAGGVKRLHDRNKSGWLCLVGLIPLLGQLWLFIECCLKGTNGENDYGSDPL